MLRSLLRKVVVNVNYKPGSSSCHERYAITKPRCYLCSQSPGATNPEPPPQSSQLASQPALELNSSFSEEDTKFLLNIFNHGDFTELSAYKISKARAVKLIKYRTKHGNFETLSQILHVDDFGVNLLQQLCRRMVNGISCDSVILIDAKCEKRPKRISVSSPPLSTELRTSATSVLGIHITPSTLSWAKLDRENTMQAWGSCDLLQDEKRQHHGTLLEIVHNVVASLPEADIYVMEERGGIMMGIGSNVALSAQLLQIQAMLIALLNRNFDCEQCNHQVFTIKSPVVMRLFDLQVGTERVSGQTLIDKMLRPSLDGDIASAEGQNAPGYSSVTFPDDMRDCYKSQNVFERENLSNSLLIALAFSDIVLHERQVALDVIHRNRKPR